MNERTFADEILELAGIGAKTLKVITLKRVCLTDDGVFGVMIEEGLRPLPFCLTLELPWRDNKPNESCIPENEYHCELIRSPSKGMVYEIKDVPNRTNVLIHKGNFTTDSLGCVLLGEQFEEMLNPKANKVVPSVASSGAAFNEFMNIRLAGQVGFTLVIKKA